MRRGNLVLAVFGLHLAATLMMTGTVWFVQIVHYPLLRRVGLETFPGYAAENVARSALVLAPVMLVEMATGVWLLFERPAGVPVAGPWLGLALLAVVAASTALLALPQHAELQHGFDEAAYKSLVSSNWIRVAAWSARSGLVLWMAWRFALRRTP